MGISVWRKLDCYCLLRILEIRMNPQIGYVARRSDSTVTMYRSVRPKYFLPQIQVNSYIQWDASGTGALSLAEDRSILWVLFIMINK